MEVEISGGIFCLHEVAPLFESLPAYKEMNKKAPYFAIESQNTVLF